MSPIAETVNPMLLAKYYRLPVDPLLIILAVFAVAATIYVVRSLVKNRRR